MNKSIYTLWLVAAAGLLAVGNVGCKQTAPPAPEVPDMIEGSLAVAIAPSVDQKSAQAVSRLTPSTTTAAGVFETGDKVGLFVQDEHAPTTFSTINMCYTADASLVFVPTAKVYYKTYYQHGIYGYCPYNAAATNAKQFTFAIKKEQSDPKNRIACDLLTSSTPNIKPQQIDPNAPEIPMTFYHQMTNIVVRVKNSDGSALSSDLAAMPVKVFLVQRSTGVNLDLTAFTKDASGYEACALSAHTKDNVNRLNNRVFMGHDASQDAGTTMFFEGIVIPEAVVAGDTLIKVQIGPDGHDATRLFSYIPQVGDPIVAAGLTQGKEHIFDLTIKGTQLLVQGGEITDWGTGSSVSQQINGGGTTSSKFTFELTNETSVANTDQITKCFLYLDGNEYTGEVSYTAAAGGNKARLTCSINAGFSFPYWFTQAIFKNAAGTEVWKTGILSPGAVRIKGNPLESTYDRVLGVIDVATGAVTQGS